MASTGIRLRRKPDKNSFSTTEKPIIGELVMATNTVEFGWVDENNTTVWGRLENELPVGGITGQALVKSSNTDFEVEWSSTGGSYSGVEDPNTLPEFGNIGDSYSQLPKPGEIIAVTYNVTSEYDARNNVYTASQDPNPLITSSPWSVTNPTGIITGPITLIQAYPEDFVIRFGDNKTSLTSILINGIQLPINDTDFVEEITDASYYLFEASSAPINQTILSELLQTNYTYTANTIIPYVYQEWYKKDTIWVKKPTTQRIVTEIPTDTSTANDEIGTVYFVV